MRILLTGTRAPATVDLARKLTAAGCTVFGSDSMASPIGKRDLRYPSPRFKTQQFIAALNSFVASHSIDIIWPTCEEMFYVGQNLSSLACPAFCPIWDVLRLLHNKKEFIRFARHQSNAISFPREGASADTLWKREFSRFSTHVTRTKPVDTSGWFQQERIKGEEFSSWGLCRDGHLLLAANYAALARSSGSATAFMPLAAPDAVQFMSDIAAATRYTGSFAFDFIRNEQGAAYVLECNPRLTSGVHLVKNPEDILNAISGIGNDCPSLEASKIGPLLLPSPAKAFALRNLPDVLGGVSAGRILLSAIEFAAIALRHRISLTRATTFDIEFNG